MEEIVTKDRISAKIKIIQADFRKAVDSGKKSGGGSVVFTFYSLCQSLWGSSPAVNSIPNSIDSQDDSLKKSRKSENLNKTWLYTGQNYFLKVFNVYMNGCL